MEIFASNTPTSERYKRKWEGTLNTANLFQTWRILSSFSSVAYRIVVLRARLVLSYRLCPYLFQG